MALRAGGSLPGADGARRPAASLLLEFSRRAVEDPDPLLSFFAHAVLVSARDGSVAERAEHLAALHDALEGWVAPSNPDQPDPNDFTPEKQAAQKREWAALRALRTVPVASIITNQVLRILKRPVIGEHTYDALRVMLKVQGMRESQNDEFALEDFWSFTREVERTVSRIVDVCRVVPKFYDIHALCLKLLGVLRCGDSIELVLKDLSNSVVRQAVFAIEHLTKPGRDGRVPVQLSSAVMRIVHEAQDHFQAVSVSGNATTMADHFGLALRFFSAPVRDMIIVELENIMSSGGGVQIDAASAALQDTARRLMMEAGGETAFRKLAARQNNANRYEKLMQAASDQVQQTFDRNVSEARWGLLISLAMDVLVFLLGLALIPTALYLLVARRDDLSSLAGAGATGGAGVLSIIYSTLIAKPREQVQQASRSMMRLKVVFNAYLRRLQMIDQTFSVMLVEGNLQLHQSGDDPLAAAIHVAMEEALRAFDAEKVGPAPRGASTRVASEVVRAGASVAARHVMGPAGELVEGAASTAAAVHAAAKGKSLKKAIGGFMGGGEEPEETPVEPFSTSTFPLGASTGAVSARLPAVLGTAGEAARAAWPAPTPGRAGGAHGQ
eukprot:tig00021462_g21595.t1